jgi:hypothetical protein
MGEGAQASCRGPKPTLRSTTVICSDPAADCSLKASRLAPAKRVIGSHLGAAEAPRGSGLPRYNVSQPAGYRGQPVTLALRCCHRLHCRRASLPPSPRCDSSWPKPRSRCFASLSRNLIARRRQGLTLWPRRAPRVDDVGGRHPPRRRRGHAAAWRVSRAGAAIRRACRGARRISATPCDAPVRCRAIPPDPAPRRDAYCPECGRRPARGAARAGG